MTVKNDNQSVIASTLLSFSRMETRADCYRLHEKITLPSAIAAHRLSITDAERVYERTGSDQ
ncbi:hypothetical protein N5I19_25175, partial [Pseudomonas chengduensis]